MAILTIVNIPAEQGGSAEESKAWAERNNADLPHATGFLFHVDGPTETGWRLIQVWESERDLQRYFEERVKPFLPPNSPSPTDAMKVYPVEHIVAGNLQAV